MRHLTTYLRALRFLGPDLRLAGLLGLANLLVEFRQDLVADDAGAERWTQIFLRALQPALQAPELSVQRFYGSRATGA